MKKPEKDQHRIPQVYLRQWCFRDVQTNAETLCVAKRGDPVTHYKSVKSFTKETNLFDTTLLDEGVERFFDETCIKVEDRYNYVIDALNSSHYDDQTRVYLTEFISNLFVRQKSSFNFFKQLVQDSGLRKKFFNEITILDTDQPAELAKAVFEEMAIDPEHSIDSKTSLYIIQAWKHFNIALERFNHIILMAPDKYYWHTTENPVLVKSMGKEGWIMGPDVELYFPISKSYLMYMYINDTALNQRFANLKIEEINEVAFELLDEIIRGVIIQDDSDYLIMGEDHGYYDSVAEKNVPKYIPIEFSKYQKKSVKGYTQGD